MAEPVISTTDIDARFRRHRIRVMLAITLGYGFIYTCRLGLSIIKKPVIDNGIFTVEELGLMEGFPGECPFCPVRTLRHSQQKAG